MNDMSINFIQLETLPEWQNEVENQDATPSENAIKLFYFSHDACGVCKVLKPKIANLINEHFPKISCFYVNTENSPEIAAQQRIFTVPTVLIFVEGREYIRASRNMSIDILQEQLSRPYKILFS